jgi:hypothetical protein
MNARFQSHWHSRIRLTGVIKTSANRHSSVGAIYANHLHIMAHSSCLFGRFCTSEGDLMFREGLELLETPFSIRVDDKHDYVR